MERHVRLIVMNRDEGYAAELRAQLRQSGSVKIVAEVDEPALLGQAAKQFSADVVLVNLDPDPETMLPPIGELTTSFPDLAVFALSSSTDGQLILKTMRLGVREFIPKPIDVKGLGEALLKIASQKAHESHSGTLITVMGTSGGVGASMLATNLATELALAAEGRVIIVDLDYRFGQVATLLDVEPTYTLADLCATPEELEPQVIERALVKHESGLQVLSRPASLSQADTITAASCVGLLSSLLKFSAYVVADGPSRQDPAIKSILDVSDVNLLVLQLLVPTVRNTARILEGMREGGYNLDRTKLVCNRVGRESMSLSVKDISETLNLPVWHTVPDDWPAVSGAINLGETLSKHCPKSKVRLAIQEIAQALYKPSAQSDEKDGKKKGLIGRIFAGT